MTKMFKDFVYNFSRKIPKGKVATYGQLAKLAGNKKAARAVGMLMKNHPEFPEIPCHRVVGFNGRLVGYTATGGVRRKKEFLLSEGVKFKGDRVDLSQSLWRL